MIAYKEIDLSRIELSNITSALMEKYIDKLGIDEKHAGGYTKHDWRRLEYISSVLSPGKILLDIGSGMGQFLNLQIELQKFRVIIGADIKCHSRFHDFSKENHMVYLNVLNIPFKNKSIDTVVCMELLEHLDYRSFILALFELHRVGKKLIFTVPFNEHPLPKYHKLCFDEDMLKHFFYGAEFTLLQKSKNLAWMLIQIDT